MPTYFIRPDNALKRANEFIYVEKSQRALDALYDVIKSKKHRTWQKVHENIMLKYLELCVELRKSHVAKEGLYQYKNICQQMYIRSLEDVVRKYLSMAEEKTEEARLQSHEANVSDVDDLDVIMSPESLLLSAVSGEDSQDRTDRTILIPWVKFLWESYRQCLELLRNNNRVETLYRDIAQQAFKFCLKYDRKTEFRKLCENLRTHLGHIQKHQNQQTSINLKDPETLALHMEIRISQLDSAIQMELWQEAFKAVEDIYGLVTLSKKPPKPSLMASYYQKQGLVFWKSGNRLFHAAAWHRLFHLYREQKKGMSTEELQKMASRVVVATLAVPNPPRRDKLDVLIDQEVSTMDKQRRLAGLLSLTTPPTRAGLVKDLSKYNIINNTSQELQDLYYHLEVDFNPLCLADKIDKPMVYIKESKELNQYVDSLHQITVMQVIRQVSQVYDTIEFSRLLELVPFTDSFSLEHMVVESARSLDLQVRIDHRTHSLSFGSDLAGEDSPPEAQLLQTMPSEQIRSQLTLMADALSHVKAAIQSKLPGTEGQRPLLIRAELRMHLVQTYKTVAKRQHHAVLQRRQIIEDRKEELENISNQREQEEQQKVEEERQKQAAAERERLDREMEERAKQRREEERRDIAMKHAREKLEQLKKSEIGARAFKDIDESHLAELDPDEIVAKQVRQIEKEKRELQDKLRAQEKKVDHLARAKHEDSIPMYKEQYDKDRIVAQEFWELEEAERIANLVTERENALANHERLIRMKVDRDSFLNNLKEARKSIHKDNLKEFEKKLEEERKKRLLERKVKRKEEKREKWQKAKDDEEQRKKDEALKKEKARIEDEERRKDEERSRAAEKQRIKEIEMEDRRKEQDRLEKERAIEETKRVTSGRGRDGGRDGDRDRDRDRDRSEPSDAWRRGGPGGPGGAGGPGNKEDGPPSERGGAWRPNQKEGGWRDKLKLKGDKWQDRRDEPGRDGEDDMSRDSQRDEDPRDRDEMNDEPPRKTYSERREESYRDVRLDEPASAPGPPREDAWRRAPPAGGSDRPERRDEPERPRFDDRERRFEDRGGRGGFERGGGGLDRRGPADDRDTWRRGGDRGGERGGDRGGDRGGERGGDRGGDRERDAWRTRDSDRGTRDFDRGSRDGPRDFGPRDDRRRDDRGPRDFDRGSRDGPRDFDRGPRDAPRDFDRGPRDGPRDFERRRDDRGPPSRDFGPRDSPRRGEEGGGSWRKGGEAPPPPPPRGGDAPPAGDDAPSRGDDRPKREAAPKRGGNEEDEDGWTQVR